MKNKYLKTIIITLIAVIGLSFFGFCPNTHADDDFCNSEDVPQTVKDAAGCNQMKDQLPDTIEGILNAIILVSGTIAVIFVLIGGINYMTSSGDASKLEKAKKTILYAAIGLAVCTLAFAIVNWTIGAIRNAANTESSEQQQEEEEQEQEEETSFLLPKQIINNNSQRS